MIVDFAARALAAGWLVACTAVAAYAAARALLPVARLLERIVATAVCGLWLATVGFHALAAAHAYALGPALAGCTALGAVALRADRGLVRALRRDWRGLRALGRRALHGPERLWNLGFLVCAAPVALRPWLLPPLGWDSLTYHAVKAVLWIQHQGALPMTAPGSWSYYRDRWAGADVMLSWAMLPMRSDLLATMGELVQWVCLAVCVLCLARTLGARTRVAAAAAAFYLSLPTLRMLIGSGYSEPVTCLCFGAGCLFVVRYARTRQRGLVVLAAAAIGLALGMKILFARACVVLLAALLWAVLRRRPAHGAFAALALASAGALAAPVVPWALRAMAETGLPLSPLPITVLGVALGRASPEVAWLMTRVDAGVPELSAELRALAVVFGSPTSGREVLTWLALLPLGLAFAGVVVQARRRTFAVVTLCAAFAVDLLTHFSADMTALRIRWPETSSRVWLAAMLVATALGAAWTPSAARAARAQLLALRGGALLLLVAYAHVGWSWRGASLAAGLVAAFALALFAVRAVARRPWPLRAAFTIVVVLALLSGLAAVRSAQRYALMESDYAVHPLATFWVPAARMLDRPGNPLRIAVAGGPAQDMDRCFAYAFFGRALQNELLYVSPLRDGSVPSYGGPAALDELAARSDAQLWIARLRRARIDCLVTFDPLSLERMIADQNPQIFRRITAPALRAFGAFELRARARP